MVLVCPKCGKRVTKDDYISKNGLPPSFNCLDCGSTEMPVDADESLLKKREDRSERFYLKIIIYVLTMTIILLMVFPPETVDFFELEYYLLLAFYLVAWLYAISGIVCIIAIAMITKIFRISRKDLAKKGLYDFLQPLVLPALLISAIVLLAGYDIILVVGSLVVSFQIIIWIADSLKSRNK